jgi:hypothetical protein
MAKSPTRAASVKRSWGNPATRAKRIDGITNAHNQPEYLARVTKRMQEMGDDPLIRAIRADTMRRLNADPAFREAHRRRPQNPVTIAKANAARALTRQRKRAAKIIEAIVKPDLQPAGLAKCVRSLTPAHARKEIGIRLLAAAVLILDDRLATRDDPIN